MKEINWENLLLEVAVVTASVIWITDWGGPRMQQIAFRGLVCDSIILALSLLTGIAKGLNK